MGHASGTLHSIDLRIRTLSFLISRLNQQIKNPDSTNHLDSPPTLVAFNHIAILLTRGIEDSNKKGIGAGRRVVAVTGRLTSNLQFMVTTDADEDSREPVSALSNAIVTQDPTPRDQLKFNINNINASKTWRHLLFSYSINNDPLSDYAADLLAALRDLDTRSNGFDFLHFVIRSCLPKISHRLEADRYVFERPLDDILDGWVPVPGETLPFMRVLLGDGYQMLPAFLANASVVGEKGYYQWGIETASIWIAAFCHVITVTKRGANSCHPSKDL